MLLYIAAYLELLTLATLVWAAWNDHTTGLLPDTHTYGAALLMLVAQAIRGQLSPALMGAVVGFGLLKLVQVVYRRIRGRDGLGSGDAKLMLAVGALVCSPWGAVWTIGGASMLAYLFNLPRIIQDRNAYISFGPYLLCSGVGCAIYLKFPEIWGLVWADLIKELSHAWM